MKALSRFFACVMALCLCLMPVGAQGKVFTLSKDTLNQPESLYIQTDSQDSYGYVYQVELNGNSLQSSSSPGQGQYKYNYIYSRLEIPFDNFPTNGDYTLRVQAEGYEPLLATVHVQIENKHFQLDQTHYAQASDVVVHTDSQRPINQLHASLIAPDGQRSEAIFKKQYASTDYVFSGKQFTQAGDWILNLSAAGYEDLSTTLHFDQAYQPPYRFSLDKNAFELNENVLIEYDEQDPTSQYLHHTKVTLIDGDNITVLTESSSRTKGTYSTGRQVKVAGANFDHAGRYTLIVEEEDYQRFEKTILVAMGQPELVKVEPVIGFPQFWHTSYYIDQPFNLSGLSAKLTYQDGYSEIIPSNRFSQHGIVSSIKTGTLLTEAGPLDVILSKEEISGSIQVQVLAKVFTAEKTLIEPGEDFVLMADSSDYGYQLRTNDLKIELAKDGQDRRVLESSFGQTNQDYHTQSDGSAITLAGRLFEQEGIYHLRVSSKQYSPLELTIYVEKMSHHLKVETDIDGIEAYSQGDVRGYTLHVSKIANWEKTDISGLDLSKQAAYEIYLTDRKGKRVQPNNPVVISIPMNLENAVLVHDHQGQQSVLEYTMNNGKAVFSMDRFSQIAFIQKIEKTYRVSRIQTSVGLSQGTGVLMVIGLLGIVLTLRKKWLR